MKKHSGQATRIKRAASLTALMVAAMLSLGQGASALGKTVQGQALPKGSAHGPSSGESVPEINPALLVGTMVLVVGAALILMDRARSRRPD